MTSAAREPDAMLLTFMAERTRSLKLSEKGVANMTSLMRSAQGKGVWRIQKKLLSECTRRSFLLLILPSAQDFFESADLRKRQGSGNCSCE